MTFDAHVNLASGAVTVAPSTPTAGLTMTVVKDAGVTLPATPFSGVVFPTGSGPTAATSEIVRVTGVVGNVWTMLRAQEGTTARTILVGDQVFIGGVTAKTLTDLETAIAAAQPGDADLTAIAGLAPANDDVIQRKGGAWTNRTIAQLLADLGLGSLFQPLDSDLTAISALTTTATGRSLLAAVDAAALRTILGLGTAATQASSAFDAAGAAGAAAAASQPLDPDLTALAAVATVAYGRSLLTLADSAALRGALAPATVTTDAAPGAAKTLTLPVNGEVVYDLTASAASCALTLAGATAGKLCTITLILRQDVTAGRAFVFPSSVAWPGQAVPSLNVGAGKYDVLQLSSVDGGTTWIGAMIASAVQPFTAPGAPVSLSVQASTGQNVLTWADTSTGGSPITSHNVYRGTASGGETLLGAGSSPYTDSGLTNGTQYYYKVTAVNAVGEGAQSAEAGAAADHYLNIPAASGASTPNQAGFAPGTNTVDLRALIQHATWTFAGNNFLVANYGGTVGNQRYAMYIDVAGKLNAVWINAAGVGQFCVSTVALPFAANDTRWVRALLNPGAGTVDFYTSIDGTTWTALGTQITGKTTTAVQTPGAPEVLSIAQTAAGAGQFTGRMWKVRLIVNAAAVCTMDFSANTGTGPWTATTGETWTRIGTAAIV